MFAGKMYGYGKIVIIKHDYNIVTVYAHLNEIHTYTGKNVDKGEKIGELGSTGRSTGNHLHYEIRIDNIPIDPVRFTKLTKELTS
jgi:murein DD-endopeptidase MepM/ murein hydrolase activator NlpD